MADPKAEDAEVALDWLLDGNSGLFGVWMLHLSCSGGIRVGGDRSGLVVAAALARGLQAVRAERFTWVAGAYTPGGLADESGIWAYGIPTMRMGGGWSGSTWDGSGSLASDGGGEDNGEGWGWGNETGSGANPFYRTNDCDGSGSLEFDGAGEEHGSGDGAGNEWDGIGFDDGVGDGYGVAAGHGNDDGCGRDLDEGRD